MGYCEYVNIVERRIIDRVLSNIADLATENPDLTVQVRDEECKVYDGKPDLDVIRTHVGHTGMTRIIIFPTGTNKVRASALFIHGNNEDVLSDSSWSDGAEWLEKRLCKGAAE